MKTETCTGGQALPAYNVPCPECGETGDGRCPYDEAGMFPMVAIPAKEEPQADLFEGARHAL